MIHLAGVPCRDEAPPGSPEIVFVAIEDCLAINCERCVDFLETYDWTPMLTVGGRRLVATRERMKLPKPGERTPVKLVQAWARYAQELRQAAAQEKTLIESRIHTAAKSRYGGEPRGELIKFPGATTIEEVTDDGHGDHLHRDG